MPDLKQKVIQMLDDNHSVGRLTWHNGIIPQTEVWVKLGGDKGGNTTKMNFQIVNVPTPNSIHNTCVFCCFAATDSVTNLHSALDRYRDQWQGIVEAHMEGGAVTQTGFSTKAESLMQSLTLQIKLSRYEEA
ncbi:hypothetical protein EMCRGX_G012356 [Ephydatia muelleri]